MDFTSLGPPRPRRGVRFPRPPSVCDKELYQVCRRTAMTKKKTKSERKKPTKNKSKPRSPSYPGINLEEAIERAKIIYERERRHETAENTILEHWGYKPKSGAGIMTLAALKAFGLL